MTHKVWSSAIKVTSSQELISNTPSAFFHQTTPGHDAKQQKDMTVRCSPRLRRSCLEPVCSRHFSILKERILYVSQGSPGNLLLPLRIPRKPCPQDSAFQKLSSASGVHPETHFCPQRSSPEPPSVLRIHRMPFCLRIPPEPPSASGFHQKLPSVLRIPPETQFCPPRIPAQNPIQPSGFHQNPLSHPQDSGNHILPSGFLPPEPLCPQDLHQETLCALRIPGTLTAPQDSP